MTAVDMKAFKCRERMRGSKKGRVFGGETPEVAS